MHIAAHPTHPTTHRAATTGRLTGTDINQLEQLGYKVTERVGTLYGPDTNTIRERASRGERGEHDLLDAPALDALRNPRT